MINLNEKYAEKILKAMFCDYDFNFVTAIPGNDMILFEIDTNNLDLENNQITLYLSENEENKITIEIYTRSENYEILGIYNIKKNEFDKTYNFWEHLFLEHLQF